MTIRVFDKTFDELIGVEGGFQNDPKDRGNWTSGRCGVGECKGTKYGISAMAYPNLDIKNITALQAKDIFRKDYWDRVYGDLLPDSIGIMVADFAYNSGCKTAIKYLQKVLGVKVDGVVGNQTLGACNRLLNKKLIQQYADERLNFLKDLKTFKVYGKGWTKRVEHIQKLAEEYL